MKKDFKKLLEELKTVRGQLEEETGESVHLVFITHKSEPHTISIKTCFVFCEAQVFVEAGYNASRLGDKALVDLEH